MRSGVISHNSCCRHVLLGRGGQSGHRVARRVTVVHEQEVGSVQTALICHKRVLGKMKIFNFAMGK